MSPQQYLVSVVIGVSMLCFMAPVKSIPLDKVVVIPASTRLLGENMLNANQEIEKAKKAVNENEKTLTAEEQKEKDEDALVARKGTYAFLKMNDELVYNRGTIPKSLFEGLPLADFLGPVMANHSMEVSSEELGAADSAENKKIDGKETADSLATAGTTNVTSEQESTTKQAKKVSVFFYSLGDRHFTYYNDPASKTKYVHQHQSDTPSV